MKLNLHPSVLNGVLTPSPILLELSTTNDEEKEKVSPYNKNVKQIKRISQSKNKKSNMSKKKIEHPKIFSETDTESEIKTEYPHTISDIELGNLEYIPPV